VAEIVLTDTTLSTPRPGGRETSQVSIKRVAVASFVGTLIEFYDFGGRALDRTFAGQVSASPSRMHPH